MQTFRPDMLAYCGLYCEQCSFRVASLEQDPSHMHASPYEMPPGGIADCFCAGCKQDAFCGPCAIRDCASQKEIVSCADCADFPCAHLTSFAADGRLHHALAVDSLRAIRSLGYEAWFRAGVPPLVCRCGHRNSWYKNCSYGGIGK